MFICAQHISLGVLKHKLHQVTALLTILQQLPAHSEKMPDTSPWPLLPSRLTALQVPGLLAFFQSLLLQGFVVLSLALPGMFFPMEHYSFFHSFQISGQMSLLPPCLILSPLLTRVLLHFSPGHINYLLTLYLYIHWFMVFSLRCKHPE